MKHVAAMAVVLGLLASGAHAVITVNSAVESVDSPTSIRTQAIITDPAGLGGSQFMAVAIKEIDASILIRDGQIQNGLRLTKRQLTPTETYGADRPMGYNQPPFTDPEGPWFGLMWPYRDQYDYFARPTDPLGDDVGTVFEDQPGVYGVVNIQGVARGGPTDPVDFPGSPNPEWLARGITGNGLSGPASYFAFDIDPLLGPFDRLVRLRIFGASAIVVQQDTQSGAYSEIRVPIPDFEIDIRIPEPASGMTFAALTALLALRRRR